MKINRNRIRTLLFVSLLTWIGPVMADSLQRTEDLQALGTEAASRGLPILLLVSQEHCGYCKIIKRELLRPMEISGEYTDRALIREIFIDFGETLKDFNGRELPARDLATGYKVDLTPTMLFLASDGRELSKRIIGVRTIEMLSWYVDAALDDALGNLQKNTVRPAARAENRSESET